MAVFLDVAVGSCLAKQRAKGPRLVPKVRGLHKDRRGHSMSGAHSRRFSLTMPQAARIFWVGWLIGIAFGFALGFTFALGYVA